MGINAGNRTIGVRLATFEELEKALTAHKKELGVKKLSWEQFLQMMLASWKKSKTEGLKNR